MDKIWCENDVKTVFESYWVANLKVQNCWSPSISIPHKLFLQDALYYYPLSLLHLLNDDFPEDFTIKIVYLFP
jgi:hypothetical protein